MGKPNEHVMDRTLRWMSENLTGAQNAVHPPGHENAGEHCTNSGTGLIVCCYINALGKVLLKGGGKGHGKDQRCFKEFVRECMQDFLQAQSTKALPRTPGGRTGGEDWLYHVFRCGFVHGFYPPGAAWFRSGKRSKRERYWILKNQARPALNIDRLVLGFTDGVQLFKDKTVLDPDLRDNFKTYITM